MIPKGLITEEIEIKTQPSLQHKMNLEREFISGKCDGAEAMKQVIYKILLTERYKNLIYSWRYGVELSDLFGKPAGAVMGLIESRIREALIQDDRINSVESFKFDTSKRGVVITSFTAKTIFGDIDITKEVAV